MFEGERASLQAIAQTHTVRVPTPIKVHTHTGRDMISLGVVCFIPIKAQRIHISARQRACHAILLFSVDCYSSSLDNVGICVMRLSMLAPTPPSRGR